METPVKRYAINDCFYSVQGEGVRAGTVNIFVRFQACNMKCAIEPGDKSPGGFDCDTEFESGRLLTASEILSWAEIVGPGFRKGVIFTGGEPALQLDIELLQAFRDAGYAPLCIETNGSVRLPTCEPVGRSGHTCDPESRWCYPLDWITVSPKVAEHAIRQVVADEVKYVRAWGQGIPKTVVEADHKLISPAFSGGNLDKLTLAWCIQLVKDHPDWRLSVQNHQIWGVR